MCDTAIELPECIETKIENEEWIFVDIQGFKVNKNRFMCKEFCLIDGDETFHAIVKSWYPYSKLLNHYKRQIDWLTNHFHALKYDCGEMHINELTNIVYPKLENKIVIVKGFEKIGWMKYMFRKYGDISCRNVENLNYDMSESSNGEYTVCEFHNAQYGWGQRHCAMSNAKKLKYISDNIAPIRFF